MLPGSAGGGGDGGGHGMDKAWRLDSRCKQRSRHRWVWQELGVAVPTLA